MVAPLKLYTDNRVYGVPRHYLAEHEENLMWVPDEIRKCVVFLGINTDKGGQLIGTGFFVSRLFEETGTTNSFRAIYLVTARHVIEQGIERSTDKKIYIRINTKAGPAELVDCPADMWKFSPVIGEGYIDVASIMWVPDLEKFDIKCVPWKMAAIEDVIEKAKIGPGDEVFLTGLFINHFGKNRNIPIVRIGNIAAMPEEKIETDDFGEIDAYLVEARSIGGLSGSPVFANLSGLRGGEIRAGDAFVWLGLMHGHWDAKIRPDDTIDKTQSEKEKVNMGIAIVVPVTRILETLTQKEFEDMIEAEKVKYKKDSASTPDIAKTEGRKNPKHKEDFNRLLDEATKGKKPKKGK